MSIEFIIRLFYQYWHKKVLDSNTVYHKERQYIDIQLRFVIESVTRNTELLPVHRCIQVTKREGYSRHLLTANSKLENVHPASGTLPYPPHA
jgi:hypothetical protein